MQIFEYKNFKIVGDSYSNSRSWGHTAVVFKDNYELSKSKIRYFNRTWERYTYQMVILDALYDEIKRVENRIIANYKDKSGATRITKRKREELIECDKEIIELRDVYDYFNNKYGRSE